MADSKISALASGSPAQAGDEYVVARSGANYKLTLTNIAASMPPIGATTPNSGAFTTLSASGGLTLSGGNLAFTGTAQRITGDFSNATLANRLAFQTSTTNGNTGLFLLPNGTSTIANVQVANAADPTNSSVGIFGVVSSTDVRIQSAVQGTGTYLPMTFYTGGSERVRIDTSGNVGIGVTSPITSGARLSVKAAGDYDAGLAIGSNASAANWARLDFKNTNAAQPSILYQDQLGTFSVRTDGAYPITFQTNGANERMRIDSSGNVGIGTSSPSAKLHVAGGSGSTIRNTASSGSSWFVGSNVDSYILHNESNTPMVLTTNATERMRITAGGEVYIAGTTDQGAYNLQCNGTGVWGAGAYVNGSDERLKDDITTLDDGLNVVKQLRPVTFKYKPDYSRDQSVQTGFIAQELQAALEGKDYLDGVVQAGPTYLNVAYQSLIPILAKAIQEQQVIIDELKAKVAALEAK